jgi:hypothetical protein
VNVEVRLGTAGVWRFDSLAADRLHVLRLSSEGAR